MFQYYLFGQIVKHLYDVIVFLFFKYISQYSSFLMYICDSPHMRGCLRIILCYLTIFFCYCCRTLVQRLTLKKGEFVSAGSMDFPSQAGNFWSECSKSHFCLTSDR